MNPRTDTEHSVNQAVLPPNQLANRISPEDFDAWYREREFRRNIQDGTPFFNGPSKTKPPEQHSPSQMLQCHRKLVYRKENAPEEQSDPSGIYWVGEKFEEDLIFPFLSEWVTSSDTYVQNSIWIDYSVETCVGELRIKGSTDPVIVGPEGVPILPTEIKTKSEVNHISEPNAHHRAQVYAYLAGLSEKFDKQFSHAVIVYGSRESLDVKAFEIEFDSEFWKETVLGWAETHTEYRLNSELPPANPEYDWECQFCEYRNRCGEGETPHQDYGLHGFLPGYDDYPREKVVEYLDAKPEAALTPSLAREYPDLAEEYDVLDWYCQQCSTEVSWDAVDSGRHPRCPRCATNDDVSPLSLLQEDQQ